MLRQVHGDPQLHLPQDEDAGPEGCHHHLALDKALATQLQGMAEEAMASKQRHAGNFKSAEGTKDVPLDPKTPDGKTLKISATLDSK